MNTSSLPPEFKEQALNVAKADCFGPPQEPCLCGCLHCRREVMSDQMWFQATVKNGRVVSGFWRCPTPNCDGAGFGFDIYPLDPERAEKAGIHYVDDAAEGGDDEPEDETWVDDVGVASIPTDAYDPAEPQYADDGEEMDDDIEGEEWKHGLQPGEQLPKTAEMAEARQRWEAEQRRYDEPDDRPRWIDRTGELDPPQTKEDDIPF